jgi:PmbA protein
LTLLEDPFVKRGKGSSPFDEEGVKVQARQVVEAGCVQGYFLSSYSARKLGMKTTGNAGGSHNLTLSSRLTKAGDNLDAMLQKLGTGLFVTELMGSGVNYVTGDYSRGASGFWVENGRIAFPVEEITIAGNMKDHAQGDCGGRRRHLQLRRQDGGVHPGQPMKVAGSCFFTRPARP